MTDDPSALAAPPLPTSGRPLSRRDFVRLLGGGIIVLFNADLSDLLGQEARTRGYPTDFNAYLRIAGDGRVTVYSGKIEMGQGVVTSLAQMAADELAVSLDSIDMVMGDTALCPFDMGTYGSMSTRFFGPALRAAAAEAKAVLLTLAAEHLKAPPDTLARRGRRRVPRVRSKRNGSRSVSSPKGRRSSASWTGRRSRSPSPSSASWGGRRSAATRA